MRNFKSERILHFILNHRRLKNHLSMLRNTTVDVKAGTDVCRDQISVFPDRQLSQAS
jgi:hypothetical protein